MSSSDEPNQVVSESDYEIGQDNIKTSIGPFGLDIHNSVFLITGLGIFAFVIGTLIVPEQAADLFKNMRNWVTGNFSWFFLLAGNIFVFFVCF